MRFFEPEKVAQCLCSVFAAGRTLERVLLAQFREAIVEGRATFNPFEKHGFRGAACLGGGSLRAMNELFR